MSEEQKENQILKEETKLQILLGDNGKELVLKDGTKVKINPLRFTEISDLEDITGKPFSEIFGNGKALKFKDLLLLFWLSVRRSGLSKEEVENKAWKIKLSDVGDWFDFGDLDTILSFMESILKMSGFTIKLKNELSQPQQ